MDLEGGHFETSSISDAELEQLLEVDEESGEERELEPV